MSVRNSYHADPARQARDERLRVYAQDLLVLAAETLRDRAPRTAWLSCGADAAAIPTAATASRDERHAATLSAVRGLAWASGGISVSHTRGVSLVLHGPDPERFGIDLERTAPERSRLAGRIRSDLESATLPLDAPWIDVLRCFCAKEAAFKALASEAQAGLTFRKLAVDRAAPSGTACVRRVADGLIVAEACVVADANLVVAVAKAVPST